MTNALTMLEEKKQRLDGYQPFPPDLLANLTEWFTVELTYTSNAIEGNTLSRAETALVIEKGLTVEGKTLKEHIEAVNHAEAFAWIMQKIHDKNHDITEHTILDIHKLILQKIDDTNAGRYRTIPVRIAIAGSTVIMPNAVKVPELMTAFISWLQKNNDHPVTKAMDAHFKLVSIHPFVDGNGRTARLLMDLLLMQAGYPPALIRKEDRKEYISSIEKAQLGGSLSDYYHLMIKAIDRSFDVYFHTLEEKEYKKILTEKPFLKIGEFAKLADESVPTIRYWTKEGLLHVGEFTKSGYQLYDPKEVSVAKTIRKLQRIKRLTLKEIKKEQS